MDASQTWDEPRPVKLTIDDFMRLDEAGAFDAYHKTELIDGVVLAMNAQYSTHARVMSRFFRRLADAVETSMPGYEAWVEVSTALSTVDMPEPDIVVTRFQAVGRKPVPADTIALLVEVSDASKRYDLGAKARLYAGAGVPEYWVVDVAGALIHQHWAPQDGSYAEKRKVRFGQPITAATVPALAVATDGL